MKVLKATVIIADYNGVHNIVLMDVIEHEGRFWLVPEWLDNQVQKVSRPLRIVSLETLPHQRVRGNPDFVVNDPIPKRVFDGRIPPEEADKYVVLELPEVFVPILPRTL